MCNRQTSRRLAICSIVAGMALLIGGVCTILIWAFLPDFSNNHPVGLRTGALICAFGVLSTLPGIVFLFRWQVKLDKFASRFRSVASKRQDVQQLNNAYQFPSESVTVHKNEELFGTLKKAKSIAYMSLGPVQPENIKLLGVVHATISTTNLDHLLHRTGALSERMFGGRGSSRIYLSREPSCLLSSTNFRQTFLRDKLMRRSLPRVLIQKQNKTSRNVENHVKTYMAPLAKAKSEGLNLDQLNQQNRSAVSQSSECETEIKLRPAQHADNLPRSSQQTTTPPAGQASLFTLNNHLISSGCKAASTDAPQSSARCQQDSGTSLERTASGKRYLLMNQSGQVISCTTLFDDEEIDDDASGVGCRRLQKCTGWSLFPLFVGHERADRYALSDEERLTEQNDPETKSVVHAVHGFVHSHLETGVHDENEDTPKLERLNSEEQTNFKLFARIRRFLSRHSRTQRAFSRRRKFGCTSAGTHSITSTYSKQIQEKGYQKPRRRKRVVSTKSITDSPTPDYHSLSEEPCKPLEFRSRIEDNLEDTCSSGNLQIDRKHTIVSNASVFSLPAMPPEMWTVERPLWIMGVPVSEQRWVAVDARDLILLRKSDRTSSVDSIKPVTGSRSSMFAFHVKPPSRLKPATRIGRMQHVRARSLGRIRLSEKQLALS